MFSGSRWFRPGDGGVRNAFRPDIPLHVADVIRSLHPDLKRSVKAAVRAIAIDPNRGEPLKAELKGLRKYRVRRFRIVYAIDSKTRTVRLMAVGHRRDVYEEVAARFKNLKADTAEHKK